MQTKNTTDGTPEQKREEQQALALLKEGKLQKAEAVYRKIVTEGTKNPIVYENLAAICGIRGRYNELTELLKEALRINPNNPESYINLGNAFKEKGDLKSAINPTLMR